MLNYNIFLFVVFITNILQSITGFAGTMLAMPISILLIGIEPSKAILNFVGMLASLWIVIRNKNDISYKELIKIIIYMGIGILIGGLISLKISSNILLKIYGIIIILITLKKMLLKNEITLSEWILKCILLIAGIIHGIFISGGSFLVIYAAIKLKNKSEFRATLSAVWVILNFFLMLTHIYLGYFKNISLSLNLLAILFMFVGVIIGSIIHKKIEQKIFLKITYILLLISGILVLR